MPAPISSNIVIDSDNNNDVVLNAINGLQQAIQQATAILSAFNTPKDVVKGEEIVVPKAEASEESSIIIGDNKEIPDDMYFEEQEAKNIYTQEDYARQHNRIRNIIAGNVLEKDEEHSFEIEGNTKHKLPLFAQVNTKNFKSEGTIDLEKEININGKDILDMTPVPLNVITKKDGEVDVLRTLGLKVFNGSGQEVKI